MKPEAELALIRSGQPVREGERGHFKVRERFVRHLEMAAKAGAPPGYPEWREAPEHLRKEVEELLSEGGEG